MKNIQITEIFAGHQFEGKEIGKVTIFIRYFPCNMFPRCIWCDVIEYKGIEMTIKQIISKIKYWNNIKHVTFTGGDFSMNQKILFDIMDKLQRYNFSLETNGLVFVKTERFDSVVVSPKKQNINKNTINKYKNQDNVIFKFVIENKKNYEFWKGLIKELDIPKNIIFMMPKGTSITSIRKKTIELSKWCIEDGFNLSPRVQILLYGKKKGV